MASDEGLILLTGATGYVGGRLLPRLLALGRRVRCLARRPQRLGPLPAGAEAASGDLRDMDSLRSALAGVEVAYYLVHSLGEAGDYREDERACARNFAAAAREAGVRRIVYLGGLGGEAGRSDHLAGRREAGRLLRESGADVVELRSSIVIGSGSASFEVVRALVERLPVMITPRWVRVKTQPIAVDDLLDYLVAALDVPARGGALFEVGGRDAVTYEGIMREYARQRELRRLILPVPLLTPWLSSLWLALVTPLHARVGRRLFTSLRSESVVRDDSARKAFPGLHPQGMREAVTAALADEAARLRYVDRRSVRVEAPAALALQAAERAGRPYGSWYLDSFEAGHHMRLTPRMPLPGRGKLDIEVSPEDSGSRLTMTASFEPLGVGGRLYWRAMWPAHAFIFRRMMRSTAHRARKLARA